MILIREVPGNSLYNRRIKQRIARNLQMYLHLEFSETILFLSERRGREERAGERERQRESERACVHEQVRTCLLTHYSV